MNILSSCVLVFFSFFLNNVLWISKYHRGFAHLPNRIFEGEKKSLHRNKFNKKMKDIFEKYCKTSLRNIKKINAET